MARTPATESLYEGDGVTAVFQFAFPYLGVDDIFVSVDGVNVSFTLLPGSTAQVQTTVPPAAHTVVRVYRSTLGIVPEHLFAAGVPFLPRYVDENNRQLLYVSQEAINDTAVTAAEALQVAEDAKDIAERAEDKVDNAIIDSAYQLRLDLAEPNGATLVGSSARLSSNAAPQTVQERLDRLLPISYAGFQVQANKTINGPDNKRFIARAVQMFDYLFVSFEPRTDMRYRSIYNPPGKGPGTGISEPTYFARVGYIDAANVEKEIRKARTSGANMIRVGVEPAVQFATVNYVDPVDGKTYPSDVEMLDVVVDTAERLGMAIQLQQSQDLVSVPQNVTFLKWLTARYYDRQHVWINPANEINGAINGGVDVNNPTLWAQKMREYMIALRADIPGKPAGTKFLGPVSIDPPGWASRIDLIAATLDTDPPFYTDPNLVINVHYYSQMGEADWRTTGLVTYQTRWVNYIGTYCIMCGEVGIDNFPGRFDPNLDPGVPSNNLITWGQMQSAVTDFLNWCDEQVQHNAFNGVIGHMFFAYIPGMGIHDDNSMYRQDGSITTWGSIFKRYFLAAPVSLLEARRALGAQRTTGAWLTGDIANDAIINRKLANMPSQTIKGRVLAGTDDPEDLTSAQVLQIIAGLSGRVSNGSIGSPLFQAESLAGARGAAAFIGNSATDAYVGFINRATNTLVGSIVGNGTTGVTYNTTSDYRLKSNPQTVSDEEALRLFAGLRPVNAGWHSHPEAGRELMFLAHEVQAVYPHAVTGTKDDMVELEDGTVEPRYQSMDYGRITPLITAALHAALHRIDELTKRLDDLENTVS